MCVSINSLKEGNEYSKCEPWIVWDWSVYQMKNINKISNICVLINALKEGYELETENIQVCVFLSERILRLFWPALDPGPGANTA